MLVETVQYYDENGRQPVYVLQLDASKAFDRVSYSRLFNVLLDKNVCPYIARLLCYMYLNQNCCVKWNSKNSTDFSVSNGLMELNKGLLFLQFYLVAIWMHYLTD